jgi:short subunit dehydrogenase-like uncharacterized protein
LIAESCLANCTHYLDLSNEIPSLVALYTLDAAAKAKDLTVLPGLGFSPAASNCLVKYLHTLLPDADSVDIALEPFLETHVPGANLTIAENLAHGGFRRRDGALEHRRFGGRLTERMLPTGLRRLLPSALGDVEAAYRCTKIPNIATYIVAEIPSLLHELQSAENGMALHSSFPGSGSINREHFDGSHPTVGRRSWVWARISKSGKDYREGWLRFGEGHDFTAAVVVASVLQFLKGKGVSTGAHTPATALGADFILSLPNVERRISH